MQVNPESEVMGVGTVDYLSNEAIPLSKGNTITYTAPANGYIFYRGLFGEYVLSCGGVIQNGGDPDRWSNCQLPVRKGNIVSIFTSCDNYNCWFVPIKP